jgi:hypothetical protein
MESKRCKIGLCILDENNKPVASKILETRWNESITKDLKENFNVEIEREIAIILLSEIKKSITEEVVYNLLKGIKDASNICSSVS